MNLSGIVDRSPTIYLMDPITPYQQWNFSGTYHPNEKTYRFGGLPNTTYRVVVLW